MLGRTTSAVALSFVACAGFQGNSPTAATSRAPAAAAGGISQSNVSESSSPPTERPLELPDGDSLWMGTVGDAFVTVELRVRGQNIGGRYYYTQRGRSLVLHGRGNGKKLILAEQTGEDDAVFGEQTASIVAEVDGDHLRGSWKSLGAERNQRPLQLTRTPGVGYFWPLTKFEQPVEAEGNTFSTLVVHEIEEHLVYCAEDIPPPMNASLIPELAVLKEDCHESFQGENGKRFIIRGTRLMVLSDHSEFDVEEANQTLKPLGVDPGWSSGGTYSSEVIYAGGHILSVQMFDGGLYAGSHPDDRRYALTVDLRTGEAVGVGDILNISQPREFMEELDLRMPAHPLPPPDDHSCAWSKILMGQSIPLHTHLTPQGLYLTPMWRQSLRACQYRNFARLVPRDLAVKYARPGGLLDELLQGRWGLPKP